MEFNSFTERLRELIAIAAEGRQSRFAVMINTSQQNVNNWLNKGRFPGIGQLAAMRDRLSVNLNWLITGEGDKFILKEAPSSEEGSDGYEPTDRFIDTDLPEMLHNFNRLDDFDKRRVVNIILILLNKNGLKYEKLFPDS